MKIDKILAFISFLLVFSLIIGCASSVDPKYIGNHTGYWEGYLLGQLNQGNAKFIVEKNGDAELILTGSFNAIHKGKIKGDKFVTDKKLSCHIVDQGNSFKIVLIWEGVNVDVIF